MTTVRPPRYRYLDMPPPRGRWRRSARNAIVRVMSSDYSSDDELLSAIDAAYPFGERSRHPYKSWLQERRLLLAAMQHVDTPAPELVMPSADEAAVCLVAHDLVELGREAEARALLFEQAPNRLARSCPACKAPSLIPCREITASSAWSMSLPTRIVPHEARLTGVLTGSALGPLFGTPREGAEE